MTNLQALQAQVNLDLPLLHEKVLIDNNLSPNSPYLVTNKDLIELCSAYVNKIELTHPDFTEGKLKLKMNLETLRNRMNNIFDKNDLPDEKVLNEPQIKFEVL